MARIIDGSEMNLIGNNLKKLRQERGWSQQLLSDKLETVAVYICRGSISRIEDKQRTVTDIELYGLASVLGVSISDLFEQCKRHRLLHSKLCRLMRSKSYSKILLDILYHFVVLSC